eukprot:2230555-Pleurochrysis_carterae.AAC.4
MDCIAFLRKDALMQAVNNLVAAKRPTLAASRSVPSTRLAPASPPSPCVGAWRRVTRLVASALLYLRKTLLRCDNSRFCDMHGMAFGTIATYAVGET